MATYEFNFDVVVLAPWKNDRKHCAFTVLQKHKSTNHGGFKGHGRRVEERDRVGGGWGSGETRETNRSPTM